MPFPTSPRSTPSHYPFAKLLQGSSVCMSIDNPCASSSVVSRSTDRRMPRHGVCVCTSKHSFDGLVPSRLHTRISRQLNVQTEPQAQSVSIVIDAFVCEGFRRPFKGLERCRRAHTSPWRGCKVRLEHPAKQLHIDALGILKY